ncbi:F0F1 ATP synthase subunit A [soil metagenome]
MRSLAQFAAETAGPSVHITPSGLFTIGEVAITNSMVYGLITGVLITVFLAWAARRMTIQPQGGVIQFIEIGSEFITNLLASSLGSRDKALKYGPYFATIFFIILFNNWLGLMPGVGNALTVNGEPVFRPFTADLNATLAAAVVSMVLVQTFAIKESGFFRHLRHYFNGSMKNPVTWLLGAFEMLTEFIRVGSLALRLFLVITVGEIIIAVFTYLGGFVAPLVAMPFVFLELLVAALQAYIFVMLSVMYLAVAVKHGSEHEHSTTDEPLPELKRIHHVSG